MGVWGTGLYSGDFAMDLRATVGAVARLPFDAERLVDIICETEPAAANNPIDEDHGRFWLILADQFAKRGIPSHRVRNQALKILDSGRDLAIRRKVLEELRARLGVAPEAKTRAVLKKPQPLLMEVGDIIVYPTCGGRCINPYLPSKEWPKDGWCAAVIIDCGRAFDFLAWYRPVTLFEATKDKPTIETLQADIGWRLELPGTCSPAHFKKMEIEKIGNIRIDLNKRDRIFPALRPGISAAVSDISIANRLHAHPANHRTPSVTGIRILGTDTEF